MMSTAGSPRFLLNRHDWVYLLALLVPFVVYDLILKGLLVFSQFEEPGFLGWLVLMQSDLFFDLGYMLFWVVLFAVARKRLSRLTAVVLFHLTTIIIALITSGAYRYFKVTGSALDSDRIFLLLFSPAGTGGAIVSEFTPGLLVLILALLVYTVFGPLVVTRLVERWRGWYDDADARTLLAPVSWLRVAGVGLAAYAMFSFSLLPAGSSTDTARSFSRDAFVNVVMTAAESTGEYVEYSSVDEDPPPEAGLAPAAGTEKRNVVMIFLESTRASATTPYNAGLDTTPFLNELTKSSVMAEQAYAVVPHSNNAYTATLCGVDPPLQRWGTMALSAGSIPSTCLPDLLGEQGYNSVFFTSSTSTFENSPKIMENMGYEEFYPVETMDTTGFEQANYFGYEDDVMLKPSEQWLTQQKKSGKPFLATYATITAHHEYLAPSERYGRKQYTEDDQVNRYLNSVRYQDIFLQNLFDQYKEMGLYEDTVFVVLGDHGEAFGEHGRFQHDNVPYEEGLKIPLLVHDPRWCENGCQSGGRVKEPVNELDVLPSVANMLGYGIEGGAYRGSSLLKPLPADRTLMASCWNDRGCLASIKGKEKYIYNFGDKPDEVFDLSKDPAERDNIAGQYPPEELEKRRRELLEWRTRVNATYYEASASE